MSERLNTFDRRHVDRVTLRTPPDWQTWAMLLDVSNRLRLLTQSEPETLRKADVL